MKKKSLIILIIITSGKICILLYFQKYAIYFIIILVGLYIFLFYLRVKRKNDQKFLKLGHDRLREKHDFRGYYQDDNLKKKEIVEKELAKLYSNLF